MLFPRSYIFFFFKVSILTIIFSIFAILFFSKKNKINYTDHEQKNTPGNTIKLQQDMSLNNTQVDILIEEIATKNIEQEHNVAYRKYIKKQYQQICTRYKKICKKTTRDGQYSEQEKLQYQALIIYLLKKQNNYLQQSKNIEDVLSYIKLYQSEEGRRGSAGHKHIRINTQKINNGQELWGVLSHELGHIIDFSLIRGKLSAKDTTFTEFGKPMRAIDDPSLKFYAISWLNETARKKTAKEKDFVSGYAMKGVYEDFAESAQLWFNHNNYFKKLAESNKILQKKYNYLSKIYNKKYFRAKLLSNYPNINIRKRDTTRL